MAVTGDETESGTSVVFCHSYAVFSMLGTCFKDCILNISWVCLFLKLIWSFQPTVFREHERTNSISNAHTKLWRFGRDARRLYWENDIRFVSNPFSSYILAMNHLCSMQQAERMKCSHFLLPVEFLCSSHSFLSGPLSLSLSLSLKRVNVLPTHIAADVMLFPGIGHQQGNVNAEWQIRCTLTSVQSHAVITSSSVCESKTTRLIISYNTLQSPRRQRESDAFKEMLLCIFPPLFMELCKMI